MAVTSAAPILENAANFLGHSAQAAKRVPLSAIAGGLVGAGTYVHRRKEGDTQVEAMLSGVTTGAAVAGLTHLFTEKTGVFSRWGERAATAERTVVENTTSEQVARARGMAEAEASRGAESQLQKDAAARGQSAPVDEDIPHYDVEAEQAELARRAKEAEASATSEPAAQAADTTVSQEVSAPSSPVQEVTPTATQAEPESKAAASEPTKTENQEVNPASESPSSSSTATPSLTYKEQFAQFNTVEEAKAHAVALSDDWAKSAPQFTADVAKNRELRKARMDAHDRIWNAYNARKAEIKAAEQAQVKASAPAKAVEEAAVAPTEPVAQASAPRKTEEQMLNERVATMAQGRKSLPLSTVEPTAANPTPAVQPTSAPVGFKSSIPGLQEAVEAGLRDRVPIDEGWIEHKGGVWYKPREDHFLVYSPRNPDRPNVSKELPDSLFTNSMEELLEGQAEAMHSDRLLLNLYAAHRNADPAYINSRIRQSIALGNFAPEQAEEYYHSSLRMGREFLAGPGADYEVISPAAGTKLDFSLHEARRGDIQYDRHTSDPLKHNTVAETKTIGWRHKKTGEVLNKAEVYRYVYVPNVKDL